MIRGVLASSIRIESTSSMMQKLKSLSTSSSTLCIIREYVKWEQPPSNLFHRYNRKKWPQTGFYRTTTEMTFHGKIVPQIIKSKLTVSDVCDVTQVIFPSFFTRHVLWLHRKKQWKISTVTITMPNKISDIQCTRMAQLNCKRPSSKHTLEYEHQPKSTRNISPSRRYWMKEKENVQTSKANNNANRDKQ